MSMILEGDRLVLGTCYYPEHWPESLWEEDLQRMLDTGIEVVRIAEFAWSKIELREGIYSFDFFDRFLDLAEKVGMKVIFCTPTATPPAWLTEKYPEVLNADMNGVLYRHGARRHYNYNSPVYQEKAGKITTELAIHYGSRKCIIGWQIDNEINCEKDVFYSESDTKAFRLFLQEKYSTLERLNEEWGTVFWNQTYTDWGEVHVPRPTYSNSTNPHEVLDYLRFISDSARMFVKKQSEIIRLYKKSGDFVTTNGIFGHLDNHEMTDESLDFMTYDSYPNFAYSLELYEEGEGKLRDRKWSQNLTEVRSISKIFGIMEQQSGANGWNTNIKAPTPRPGQLTLWTMQSIAHGADFVSYFRWRTCTMGTEIYWHGILDYSGRENRRIREVREVHEKLKKLDAVAGSVYQAQVGILKDYDNVWDAEVDTWHERVEKSSQEALSTAAQKTHTPFDYVYLKDETQAGVLAKYKVLFYPHPSLINAKRVEILKRYVAEGGKLVFGCRSAYKDMTGKCVMDKLPGLLCELTGTDIPEYSLIAQDAGMVNVDWEGSNFEASVFSDFLEPVGETAECKAIYTTDYYAGAGALIRNRFGKGEAWYYGSAWNERSARIFLEKLGVIAPYADVVIVPECCEIAVRRGKKGCCMFLLNYINEPVDIILHKKGKDLYTGQEIIGSQKLEGYGTMVIKLQE